MYNTLRLHSALGESSKSRGLADKCQKARLMQVPLVPASSHWLSSLQIREPAGSGVPDRHLSQLDL